MIKTISTEETYFIRKEVLRKGIDKPFKFEGDFDKHTFHLGAFKNDKLVGVATFMYISCNLLKGLQFQLRGMATLVDVRGEGYGKFLVDKASELLKNKHIDILWCNAREVAVEFYKKNGFKIIGDSFEIDQIGKHYKMYKELK